MFSLRDAGNVYLQACLIDLECFQYFSFSLFKLQKCSHDRAFKAGLFSAAVKQVVALMAMLVYAVYGEELREMFDYEQYPYSFYTLASNASEISNIVFLKLCNSL